MWSETHRPPLILLVVTFGAGLATGLARFPDPRLALPLLLAAALLFHRQGMSGLVAGTLFLGQLSAAGAWLAEAQRCGTTLRRGRMELLLVPIDPPPLTVGRVEALVGGGRCAGEIGVRWPQGAKVEIGRTARAAGQWLPRPEGPFGRAGGVFLVSTLEPVPGPPRSVRYALRARLFEISRRLYGDRAPLVDALLFDRHGAIDPELRDRFAASGLIHLLSISGFHVGLIIGWGVVLLRIMKVRRDRALLTATLLGIAYVAWLGWPPPATRAAALAGLACLARLRQRVVRWEAMLAATALVVLLLDPWAIADLGAWLSVLSLGGATVAVEWSDRRFGEGVLARTFSGSVGATLATAPLTAGALGTVSVAGLLLNFIGIPLAALAVPAVIVSLLLGGVFPAAASAMAAGGGALLLLLDRLAALGQAIPFGHFVTESGWRAAVPWTALLVVANWSITGNATRPVAMLRVVLASGTVLWGMIAAGAWERVIGAERPGLRIAFLDVGQGDASAIRTPHGSWLVVDAGPAGRGMDAGRRVVVPYLARRGVRRIEAVVMSHAHLDHYGGIPALFDRFPVGTFLDPGVRVADSGYAALLDRVSASGAAWHPFRRGDTLRVDGVELIALHPDTTWGEWGLDLNEDSVILLIRYGRFRALLVGDAGVAAEHLLADRAGDVDLLKVGHHGSAGASGAEWLTRLRPEVAVVSVGRGNRYGHPSGEALGRLGRAGAEVWRTDQVGTVEVWTDGATYAVAAGGRKVALPAGPPGP